MKSIYSLMYLIIILFFINGCSKQDDVIKIGAILPLTGDAAQAGVNTKFGIDLAVSEINKQGGVIGKTIEIIYEDCQGQPKLAVSSMQKLSNIDKVIAVIDNSLSNVTLAISPIANEKEIILIATGASSPKITDAGEYIFRIWNSDDLEGDVMAKFALDSVNLKSCSIFYINNDYGIGLKNVFGNIFNKHGGNIKKTDTFEAGQTDFKSQLSKILANKINSLYIVGYPTECSSIITQLKRQGYQGIILGTVVMADPIVKDALNNTKYTCFYPVPKQPSESNSTVANFINKFQLKYNKKPPMLADVGYDAVYLLYNAISSKSTNKSKEIKKYFETMTLYSGASGEIKFDENGDVRKPIVIKKY